MRWSCGDPARRARRDAAHLGRRRTRCATPRSRPAAHAPSIPGPDHRARGRSGRCGPAARARPRGATRDRGALGPTRCPRQGAHRLPPPRPTGRRASVAACNAIVRSYQLGSAGGARPEEQEEAVDGVRRETAHQRGPERRRGAGGARGPAAHGLPGRSGAGAGVRRRLAPGVAAARLGGAGLHRGAPAQAAPGQRRRPADAAQLPPGAGLPERGAAPGLERGAGARGGVAPAGAPAEAAAGNAVAFHRPALRRAVGDAGDRAGDGRRGRRRGEAGRAGTGGRSMNRRRVVLAALAGAGAWLAALRPAGR